MIFHIHNLSRVFTIDKRTYQVCLDCGEKIELSEEARKAWNVKPAERLAQWAE